MWGDQAENCNKYLAKGRSVYVEGRLQTRSYDKDGQKHYATDIVADRVVFLGSGGGGEVAAAAAVKAAEGQAVFRVAAIPALRRSRRLRAWRRSPASDDDIPF